MFFRCTPTCFVAVFFLALSFIQISQAASKGVPQVNETSNSEELKKIETKILEALKDHARMAFWKRHNLNIKVIPQLMDEKMLREWYERWQKYENSPEINSEQKALLKKIKDGTASNIYRVLVNADKGPTDKSLTITYDAARSVVIHIMQHRT
ncbi:MAG: hypothetical protein COT74_12190 [Bdellovibrionales bacterium CG10_big_fil_rev_8_21_14_0_10_45_34]|nr:MAG: hypothetical protein COT74_12190 [Bdellovibrionales bacterium CG10_big_fil_rev_8_21_14_0_10_45_34]